MKNITDVWVESDKPLDFSAMPQDLDLTRLMAERWQVDCSLLPEEKLTPAALSPAELKVQVEKMREWEEERSEFEQYVEEWPSNNEP